MPSLLAYFPLIGSLIFCPFLSAQYVANYDESKIPTYTLPDPLVGEGGEKIENAESWKKVRRPELLDLFAEQVYGYVPNADVEVSFEVAHTAPALNGLATRKEVNMQVARNNQSVYIRLLLYIPAAARRPVPAFLGLNFYGNHTIHADTEITLTDSWVRDNEGFGISNNRASEESRGVRSSRWQVEMILKRGYALANIYYGDIDPDFDDDFQNGIHPLFYKEGQNKPEAHEWGSIAAWAWALSRALDYLEEDPDINGEKVAVFGHSRLGKTSLWAGAVDERFAMVISNNSGCGGAALSRRRIGERVSRINNSFPHWFCDNFTQYNEKEADLPIDQHQLISLMAPRPVYIASAEEDQWADPKGEFLSGLHADPVYRLLGKKGMTAKEMPKVNKPVNKGYIGYHIRTGKHDVTAYDWEQYLDFADRHLRN